VNQNETFHCRLKLAASGRFTHLEIAKLADIHGETHPRARKKAA